MMSALACGCSSCPCQISELSISRWFYEQNWNFYEMKAA
uniref:Uncharacterized protein n=1 Tax=Arundo donax TaxID=35708 RepID=A0A0A9AGZ8_ARUDO